MGSYEAPEAGQLYNLATRGDRDGAMRLVRVLIATGPDGRWLSERLIAPALRHVGLAWEHNRLDVRGEQAATAILQDALSEIAGSAVSRRQNGRLLIGCPPGEWHVLPARIVAELLHGEGWETVFLGASRSVSEVVAVAAAERPTAVLLSCTMPATLFTAADTIARLHRARLPVLVGGAAFGRDNRRAVAIGADAWAPSAADAAPLLAGWDRGRHQGDLSVMDASETELKTVLNGPERAGIVDSALRVLARAATSEAGRSVEADDLTRLLDLAEVGLLTSDDRVLADGVAWWTRYLDARGAPAGTARVALEVLAGALPPGPVRGVLLRAVRDEAAVA